MSLDARIPEHPGYRLRLRFPKQPSWSGVEVGHFLHNLGTPDWCREICGVREMATFGEDASLSCGKTHIRS